MHKKAKILSLAMLAVLSLGACSQAKEKMGLTKKAPDEFAVVKRAPLAMPPDYSLRPPRPGAPRPQEQSPQMAAKQTVFGTSQQAVDASADSVLLSKAGAANADPSVRNKIDKETTILNEQEQPVVKRILGLDSQETAPAQVVNAKKEAERLQKNKEAGKPVTSGETPSVER